MPVLPGPTPADPPSRSNVMVDGGAPREVRMQKWMSANGVRPNAIPILQARLFSV
jgi:hypothetical protein